ncbi:hypothetical protein [Synoicihabitans lomoniglobus]|uniref:PEP-CTERM sorting domain-containing protein n=1 Tax=Synoicihabitans lomoniglobus TaxID=2909285 RepID=A0AAF0CR06_9BACT|nr:hypothetical protein [Opitutaceae bacterium LMO-M01]WED66381.1 hypothetical protein PXH66_05910 [Opitutaceae bacterium LMO-M01]
MRDITTFVCSLDGVSVYPFRNFALFCGLTSVAWGQLTFEFDFADVNTGFNDPTLGAERRASLASGANLLANYFTTAAPRTVKITVNASQSDGSGFLASAGGITYVGAGFQANFPMQVIQSGDHSGQSSHGSMTWDFGYTWDYDNSISSGAYDFQRVAMHELTHVLGFSSYIGSDGAGLFDGNPTTYSYFDQFLTDASGNALVDSSGNYQGGTILSDGVSSDVYFNGANAVAANGGERVHMYSPSSYNGGSSLSHLDTDFYGSVGYIMTHAVSSGASVREFSAIELGILTDLGYTVSAVPEPSTLALWWGGVCLLSTTMRRRAVRADRA